MKNVKLTNKFFNDYNAHLSNGNESIRFYNDDYFLKILHEQFLTEDRIKVISRLEELKHDNVVTPEFLLLDKKKIVGYGTKNYSDYDYLDSLLESDIPFKQKKELMIKLSQIFEFFKEKKFAFYDIHGKNFLQKDGDIKVIDLDGGVFKGLNNGITYDGAARFTNYKLSLLTLSFLYGVDEYALPNFFYDQIEMEEFIDKLPIHLREYYRNALLINYNFIDFPEIINSIDEDFIEETKLQLK